MPPDDNLTPREKEVAHLLARGMNDDQIAEELAISENTVRTHRKHIAGRWQIFQHLPGLQAEARKRGYGQDGEIS